MGRECVCGRSAMGLSPSLSWACKAKGREAQKFGWRALRRERNGLVCGARLRKLFGARVSRLLCLSAVSLPAVFWSCRRPLLPHLYLHANYGSINLVWSLPHLLRDLAFYRLFTSSPGLLSRLGYTSGTDNSLFSGTTAVMNSSHRGLLDTEGKWRNRSSAK